MKFFIGMAAVAVIALGAQSAAASSAAENLGQCLYKNSTSTQRDQFVQWAYVSLGKTSAAKKVQAIPDAKTKEVNAATKETLTNLVAKSCSKEAGKVLLSDPKNGAADAMEELARLIIKEKVKSQMGSALNLSSPSSSSSSSGTLSKGIGSLLNKSK